MGGQVEAAAGEVHRQADHLVDHVRAGEGQERQQHQVLQLEPDLADDQAGRADDEGRRQVGQVPLDVGVFLFVVRRLGKHQAGLPAPPVYRGDHTHGLDSYFQIT